MCPGTRTSVSYGWLTSSQDVRDLFFYFLLKMKKRRRKPTVSRPQTKFGRSPVGFFCPDNHWGRKESCSWPHQCRPNFPLPHCLDHFSVPSLSPLSFGLTVINNFWWSVSPRMWKEKIWTEKWEDNGRDYRRMDSWAQVKSLINSLLGPGYPIRRLFH